MTNIEETAQSLADCLPASGPVVVHGEPGVGKTYLIKAMLDEWVGPKPLVFDPWDGNLVSAQQASDALQDRPVLLVTDRPYTGNWTSVRVQRIEDEMVVYMHFKVWEKETSCT